MSEPEIAASYGDIDPIMREFSAFFESFGIRRTIAIVWTYVYLSPVALGQRELGELTGLSTGMVSTALQQLEAWQAVKVIRVPGSRRLHYEPETNLLSVVRRVLRERDLRAVQRLSEAIDDTLLTYDPPVGRERIHARLRAVKRAAETYVSLFHAVERVARLPTRVPRVLEVLRGLDLSRKSEG